MAKQHWRWWVLQWISLLTLDAISSLGIDGSPPQFCSSLYHPRKINKQNQICAHLFWTVHVADRRYAYNCWCWSRVWTFQLCCWTVLDYGYQLQCHEFWQACESGCPLMPKVAHDLIAAQAPQAYTERLFSIWGDLMAGKRNRTTRSLEVHLIVNIIVVTQLFHNIQTRLWLCEARFNEKISLMTGWHLLYVNSCSVCLLPTSPPAI